MAPPRSFDWGGGRILVRQTHLPPNSDFPSDFGHFILKILKNLEKLVSSLNKKKICKNSDFWGDVPLLLSDWRGVACRHPSVGAHAPDLCLQLPCPPESTIALFTSSLPRTVSSPPPIPLPAEICVDVIYGIFQKSPKSRHYHFV